MADNPLAELSFDFALMIVTLTDSIVTPKSGYMTDQLARAGTSIGANIHEAQYAQSRKDFISKLEIALKECSETLYWLKLLFRSNRISEADYKKSVALCGKIQRLLISSCRTAKSKQTEEQAKT